MLRSIPMSFPHFALVSLLVLAAGCGSSVAGRPAARVSADTVQVNRVGVAKPIDATAMPAPDARAAAPGFDGTAESMDQACPLEDIDAMSNIETKEAIARQLECEKGVAANERAALVASLSGERAAAVTRAEATYAAYANDVCWATEEAQWVDLKDGTRDDGTLRGYAWMACESRMTIERASYLHAMRASDVAGFARHVDDAAPRGHREAFFLKDLAQDARALVAKPIKPQGDVAFPMTLDKEARAEYPKRFAAIETNAAALAKDTCSTFEGLSAALGGDKSCVRRATAAYLALGAFEANGEDAGP